MPLDKKDEEREDWFEVLGLELDATGEMVNKAFRKLSLTCHPDRVRDDPKAPERFQLITKAKEFLSDEGNRTKLAAKKRKEADRDKYNKKRFQEMDQQRKKQKVELEAREAAALAGANRGGRGGGMPMGQSNGPGINTHVLDELRKLGQRQREEEAERIEEALRKAQATPAVPPGEENEDNDDDAAAQVGIGFSAEVKVKWKRSSVEGSHSDDSLWKLFSCYGQIESIELTGTKGNSATIKFEKREAAEAAVKAYEVDDNMRVTIPADKRYKIFQKVFDPNASSAHKPPGAPLFGGIGANASNTATPPVPQKYNTGMENDVLLRMRQAAALRKQQQSQEPPPNPEGEAQRADAQSSSP